MQPNQNQKQAIEYNEGPLLIIAGPGTGKTFVITEKIKHLITKKGVKPENILALTFTEKAAFEMEERVDKALPYGYFDSWILTFHSFADRVLRESGYHIGLPLDYKILTEAESILFFKKNLFNLDLKYFRPLGNPNKFVEALLKYFSRLKDEDISPEDYKAWVKKKTDWLSEEEKEKHLELAAAYEAYQALKLEKGYLDFGDLLLYILKLFRKRPNVLKEYRARFPYILVDEFQDTNIAQYEILKLLAPPDKNPKLTVVGDDSQAIYKFRGASVSNILSFMKDYKNAKQITLLLNYRSNQAILDASYSLIKHNDPDTLEAKLGISKRLKATNKKTPNEPIKLIIKDSADDEAEEVAKTIKELVKKKKYSYKDFAILARANKHLDPFISALVRHGIPYQVLGTSKLFKQPEIKELIAYLKFLYDPEDSPSLYRVLSMEVIGIDSLDLIELLNFSRKISRSLFKAIEIYLSFYYKELENEEYKIYQAYLPLLKEKTRKKLSEIYKMLKRHLKRVQKDSAGRLLYYFLEDTKYLPKLANFKTERDQQRALNISKFFNHLRNFELEREDASVYAIVDYLELSMELGESPLAATEDFEVYDAVNLLTVHSAKGLEFPVVFLVNLVKQRFPTRRQNEKIQIPNELIKEILPEGDYHLQEERRLFYVGLTRAKDLAFLTAAKFYGNGKRERALSPFVYETLGEDFVEKYFKQKKLEKMQLTIFKFTNEQKAFPKKLSRQNYYSFSQLETFQTCPLQYKYRYILGLPSPPTAASSFGSSIHNALLKFYREFKRNKKIGLERLLEIFEKEWIPLGYSSLAHEERMKKTGRELLADFWKNFHREDIEIVDLERFFKIKIGNYVIAGKIDRVDRLGDHLEIIDYKTGKKPDEKILKKSLQLTIYALAATDPHLYNKKVDEVTLTFYYLTEPEKISFKRTGKELEDAKEKILSTIEEIEKGEFKANVGPWCDFCPFKIMCEEWQ